MAVLGNGIGSRRGIGGRTNARGERTRLAIVDALLSLTAGGDLRPTVPRVAQRAGLSLRSVFHHFNDVEALLSAAIDRQEERCAALPRSVPRELPLSTRVERFTRQRARLLEEWMPVRRSLMLHEAHSQRLAERAQRMRRLDDEETLATFADALEAVPADDRLVIEAGLSASTGCLSWMALRLHQGLPPDGARRAMQLQLAAQLLFAATSSALPV